MFKQNSLELSAVMKGEGEYKNPFYSISIYDKRPEKKQISKIGKGIFVFINALEDLTTLKPPLSKGVKIICLETLKKIIDADHTATINPIKSKDIGEIARFYESALHCSLKKINELQIEPLCFIELETIKATYAMKMRGLPFLRGAWQKELEAKKNSLTTIKEQLLKKLPAVNDGFLLFGKEGLELNNPKKIKASLEKLLGHKIVNTSQNELKKINHDVVQMFVKYRELARIINTYGENLLDKVMDNRFHASFEPIGSASGRFSCHDPNLLALPKLPEFQACIKPKHPYRLIHFDYSACELRILAALAHDSNLIRLFNQGGDMHSMVASLIFSCEVNKEKNTHLRDKAKIINFGLVYGMGEHALAHALNVSDNEAKDLLQVYFKRFNKIKEFLYDLEKSAYKNKSIKTALGRRQRFTSPNIKDEGYMKRLARNMPIQGSGADIIKLALSKTYNSFMKHGLDAYVVNVIHDELVIEAHEGEVETVCEVVEKNMKEAFNAIFPTVNMEINIRK